MRKTMLFCLALWIASLAGCASEEGADGYSDPPTASDLSRFQALCGDVSYEPATSCGADQWLYKDQWCSASVDPNNRTCGNGGDDTCYDRCESDSDCNDPCRPRCRALAMFNQHDAPSCGEHSESPKVCVSLNIGGSCPLR